MVRARITGRLGETVSYRNSFINKGKTVGIQTDTVTWKGNISSGPTARQRARGI